MPQQINDALTNADCSPAGLDGGLNLKGDPTRLSPPATTRSDNAHYDTVGSVSQMPGFVTITDKTGLGQLKPRHLYNLHAKDTGTPCQAGDMMVHAEYMDTYEGGFDYLTASMWSSSNGAILNRDQPILPFTSKTRNFGGRISMTSDESFPPDVQTNPPMFARQEQVAAGEYRKYACGFASRTVSTAQFQYVVGGIDGMTENFSALIPLSTNFTDLDVGGVQNTNYWILVTNDVSANSLTIRRLAFDSTTLATSTINGVKTQISNSSAFQIVQHAGRTYVAYYTNVATPILNFYDVITGVSYSTPIGGTLTPGFCVFSPYSHTTQTGSQFICVVKNSNAYVCHRPNQTSAWTLVGSATPLPGPNTTASSAVIQCTGAVLLTGSTRGVGGGTFFHFQVYRNFAEVIDLPTPNRNTYFNHIAVDYLIFTAASDPAASGSLSIYDTQVCRMPGGSQLSSQAFCTSPSESGFAGPAAARQTVCLIRSGAYEPYFGFAGLSNANNSAPSNCTYSQPTYFLIDGRARIVGRFLEGAGPVHPFNTTNLATGSTAAVTAPVYPQMVALPTALFSHPADSSDDTASLSITLPAWSQVSASLAPSVTVNNATYTQPWPIETVHAPTAIVLTLSSTVASCPATQGGPYTVIGGPLTATHDGYALAEANYHFSCPNIVLNAFAGSTVLGGAGVYTYVAILEWIDSQGQIVRSAPSIPTPFYSSGNFYGVTATVPKIPTSKASVFPNRIRVKLYRSIKDSKNDPNFYFVGSGLQGAAVSKDRIAASNQAVAVQIQDSVYLDNAALTADSAAPPFNAINARPRLYTGVTSTNPNRIFSSSPPPSVFWQTASKGRIFGLAQVLGQYRVYYTAPTSGTLAPEWNPFNYVPVPADIGDARSIEAIDRSVIVFGTRYNAVISGEGPGTGNTDGVPRPAEGFDVVYPIPSPAGVIGCGSPTRVPEGLIFQGLSGIQLLDRGGAVSAVGATIDQLTGRQIGNNGILYGRAVTLPSLQSVVWPNPRGPALVYSYLTKKFSTWPLLSGAAALAQRQDGTIVVALQPIVGSVYSAYTPLGVGADLGVLSATAYAPTFPTASTSPGLVLETPWILPGAASGAEARVWNVCITGSWLGPHVLQVEQAYNYEPYSLTRTIDMSVQPRQYQAIVQPLANTRMVSVRYRISLLPLTTLQAGFPMATLADLVLFSAKQQGTTRSSAALRG